MFGIGRHDGSLQRGLALALIVCALLARVLVPQGWMPEQTASGWRITLCSGSGPMTMAMPEAIAAALDHGTHHDSQGSGPSDHPCGFAGLAMALDVPVSVAIDLPALAMTLWQPAAVLAVAIGQGLVAPPPPSTGPPTTF